MERTPVSVIRVHRRDATQRVTLLLDGQQVSVQAGASLLQVAQAAGIYLPALCAHPDLPSSGTPQGSAGCGLCLVAVDGMSGLQRACGVMATAGLRVTTHSAAIQQARQDALARVLEQHPHVCLTCPQRDGCSRVMCCFNNAVEERCCSIMSHCELRKVADYLIIPATTAEYDPQKNRLPVVKYEPFYDRDYNLCIDCRRCLVACNEVRGVGCLEVKNTNGRTWVGPIADTLMASGCKFCNACVEVCPTGALLDRTQSAVQQRAAVAPCTTACPAGIDVPRYVQLAGLGRFAEANALVREKLPFPGILGRACYAPCESDCRRGNLDDPLSIRSLKRIAAEHDDGQWRVLQRRDVPTGRRVAVIGAGPAGLTAAFYLAKKGHAVTVFEALPDAGGMARYGIPAYRLPRQVIDDEVAEVAALGVEFRFNTRIEDVATLTQQPQGFDAVLVAIGAQQAKPLDVSMPGGEPDKMLPGVRDGLGFLRDVALGQLQEVPPRVTVVGGGDVACDVARSALRLGGRQVELVYRRTEAEMSAHVSEVAASLQEGVTAHFQQVPTQIKAWCGSPKDAGREAALQVTWNRTRLSKPDALGRRHLECDPAGETTQLVDLVIAAVGQQVAAIGGVVSHDVGRIVVDAMAWTGHARIFAGGDAVLGSATLIDAVAQGRQAAAGIDRFLGGDGDIEETLLNEEERRWQTDPHIGREADFNRRRAIYPARQHATDWRELESCYTHAQATAEGLRCLKCNLMHAMDEALLPPESWRTLDAVAVHVVAAEAGVYFIHDASKQVLAIKGVPDLRAALIDVLDQVGAEAAYFFTVEPSHYYSQRESELLQAYSEQQGRLPSGVGEDALDDLY
ncbi:MAG: FAD-dependent oxidoreductase [Sterolibacterium sp.]|jgi:NADPH-dependent glutamate synthase beta subunit-like oxidoreductase/Pyruvate/2-oxoacid:ferredoxin oxidoreductase delta subunit|nr:FAD-dependent oxidoreductase [Sterolibacterium sp.]